MLHRCSSSNIYVILFGFDDLDSLTFVPFCQISGLAQALKQKNKGGIVRYLSATKEKQKPKPRLVCSHCPRRGPPSYYR